MAVNFAGNPDKSTIPNTDSIFSGVSTWTWACWIRTTQTTSANSSNAFQRPPILGTVQGSGDTNDALLQINGGNLAWYDEVQSSNNNVDTGYAVNDGTWRHVGVSRAASGSLVLYGDGVARHTQGSQNTATKRNIAHEIAGAVWTANNYFVGDVAEVAMWHGVALSVKEFAILAKGFSPLCLLNQLGSLVVYQDLMRNLNRPGIGPVATATGSPSVISHPPIRYPNSKRQVA